MEAKDTVMGNKEMDAIKFDMGSPWGLADRYTVGIAIAKAQAEISFRAGIREVVEWLEKYAIHGGREPLSNVLDDLRIHSPYGKPNSRNGK